MDPEREREWLARANFEIKQHESCPLGPAAKRETKLGFLKPLGLFRSLFSEGSEISQGLNKDLFGGQIESSRYFGQRFNPPQVYIPSSLIVVISWVSFWINRGAAPARVSPDRIPPW